MIYTIRDICEFIRKNKGYYLWENKFSNEKEATIIVKNFSYNYNYKNYIKIIILQDNNYYKLFFIYLTIYENIMNIINNIKNEPNNTSNIEYIVQQLNMDNFPIIFIKYIIQFLNLNNYTLIYQDNSLQLLYVNYSHFPLS